MSTATLIFPHQLFKQNPALAPSSQVYLVEEYLFFKQYPFHKQKIVLHRASMKAYEQHLTAAQHAVTYIPATDENSDVRKLIAHLGAQGITQIHFCEVVDFLLDKRIKTACAKHKIEIQEHTTVNFLNTMDGVQAYFDGRKTYFQTDFYTQQRKQRNILLAPDGKPVGGKWTFDADNRAKYPKAQQPPKLHLPEENEYVMEAKQYVAAHFAHHYGMADAPHFYVTTFAEAEVWLQDFLVHRFAEFGIYEDAIVRKEHILHHSVLSPMLNIGLLTPQRIVDASLDFATQNDIPMNSVEGFIRQVIGWREFIRIVYMREGVRQRTRNYWGFSRKIPKSFYDGTTGIAPIDDTIKKILATGYCHHIERLMILGNFMQLCEFDPDEVHQWFMELFIDAYDWVMVPNVYGMTQFADGGLMTTKPYISGSNYLMKMSDYPKGNWQPIWDGLFWRFMFVHRSFFLKNPRLGMLVHTFDKMSHDKRTAHLEVAEQFLASLD